MDVNLRFGTVLRPNQVFRMRSGETPKLRQSSHFASDIILGLGKFCYELVHLFLRLANTSPARGTVKLLAIKECIERWAVTDPKNILPLESGQE